MNWQSIAVVAAVAAPFVCAFTRGATAADEPSRISGPAVHENLAVYFIHGKSAPGPAPLTLKEALDAGKVVVHETGNVNMLAIENSGSEEVFVQAGDIVKGGQQDRVLTVSFLVPANSGRLDIGAYCVERGRWSARGKEDVKRFASSNSALPSRDAKIAMLAPAKPRPAEASPLPQSLEGAAANASEQRARVEARQAARAASETGSRQTEVWGSVAKAQSKLSANLGANVAASDSASSMQLSLENMRLADARKAFVAALEPAGAAADDIIGYVFAIAGKVNSGDVYSSNALFRKMWAKQLDAAVTEAIAEKDATAAAAPGVDDVRAFLVRAEGASPTETPLVGASLVRETRDADKSLFLETRRAVGGFIHRAYVAR